MESVLGVVTAVTPESIGTVVSVSPSDSSDSSVPPSIPSSFEDEVLHHAKKMWSKSIKNQLVIVTIGNYILSQRQVEHHLWNMVFLVIKPQMYLCS